MPDDSGEFRAGAGVGLRIVRVEAPHAAKFTLGRWFTEWNIWLTSDCLGSLCSDATHQVAEEIAIGYGQAGQLPSPRSYPFPAGL